MVSSRAIHLLRRWMKSGVGSANARWTIHDFLPREANLLLSWNRWIETRCDDSWQI
jgi:hypothetical protein